jgi:S-formylglutathione hydrolase
MQLTHGKFGRRLALLIFAVAAVAAVISVLAIAQQPLKGRVETVTVDGKSVVGSSSGERTNRQVSIYLPLNYDNELSRRYPVLILLHGVSLTNQYWVGAWGRGSGVDVPGAMDRALTRGSLRQMIIVMPDVGSKDGGRMYSSSATSGDWEAFVAEDLVGYVDGHYRTIANPSSRGLAGHSLGGYGAILIGMKRPDVFSSLYLLSSCCIASEVAAAPLPAQPAPAASATNSLLVMLEQYAPNLKSYTAIAIDIGLRDPLLATNEQLDKAFTASGIDHSYETYDGNHSDRIANRMEQNVLPFFSEHLTFNAE